MGTAQLAFEVVLQEVIACATGSDGKWRQSRDRNRKYVLRIRNQKLCNIRPSGAFPPEVTAVTW
jgi:hypothetical protein